MRRTVIAAPLLLLAQNTGMLGAMLWLFNGQGLLVDFIAWLSIHGTTELFAILLAGAAGLHCAGIAGQRGLDVLLIDTHTA